MADIFDSFQPPPDRPAHPDYMRIVDSILWLDGQSTEGGLGVEAISTSLGFDPSLLLTVVKQNTHARGSSEQTASRQAAMWIDAFYTGFRVRLDGHALVGSPDDPAVLSKQRNAVRTAVNWLDSAYFGSNFNEAAAQLPVDVRSVAYAGSQRALRLVGDSAASKDLTTLWCDVFYVGWKTADALAPSEG